MAGWPTQSARARGQPSDGSCFNARRVRPVERSRPLDSSTSPVHRPDPDSSLGVTEVARLLKAIKLLHNVRVDRCTVRSLNKLQKCIRRYGSPTGILEGRSNNPWEALRAIQGTRPLNDQAFLVQVVNLDRLLYDRRSVEV